MWPAEHAGRGRCKPQSSAQPSTEQGGPAFSHLLRRQMSFCGEQLRGVAAGGERWSPRWTGGPGLGAGGVGAPRWPRPVRGGPRRPRRHGGRRDHHPPRRPRTGAAPRSSRVLQGAEEAVLQERGLLPPDRPQGRVGGGAGQGDPYTKLQIQATAIGEVVIKGVSANLYLAMSTDGRLFGTKRVTDECYFIERLEANSYNTYRSRKSPDWYVALKRTGQQKSGSRTDPGQKAILFLPMSAVC
ncbi:hypothetical protein ANANG_G00096460 [Anguilla anguilla]|uniref:Fibroblast growth factor n=1 Tax=Anguilla anguilla TaxID=7936 RepID=A0A9D3RYU0_ANGAN|nr:hypothetical protein ANANG_G00096460 [Anguilla anguilla]